MSPLKDRMPQPGLATMLLLGAFAAVGLGAQASTAASAAQGKRALPFTLRGARFSVRDHRLTYSVTVCTRAKSVLAVRATFVPAKRSRGVLTLTPGTTQYQDKGCWPAFVSTAVARREARHCRPIDCPAIKGHRYRSVVTVTFAHPHEVRRAARLQAVA